MLTWNASIVLALLLAFSASGPKPHDGNGIASAQAPRQTDVSAPGPYVIVLDRSPDAAGFEPVARELAEFRSAAAIVDLRDDGDGVAGLDAVFAALRAMDPTPTHVAFVVGPHRIEDTFVGRVFERATRFDDRPDVDIAYGFVTAATPAEALELVRNTRRAEEDRESVTRKFVAIGHTFREADLGLFALQQQAHMRQFGYVAEAINPIDECEEWTGRRRDEIRKLDGASLVFVAGHGAGDWLCGVDAEHFDGFTLDRAVVVNGACHSVSMLLRHDLTAPNMTVVATPIAAERSICLRFIRAGAIAQIGSTASSSWMNVAFTIPEFFHRGRTVGEALQRSLNMHIARENIRAIAIMDFEVGEPSPQFLGPPRNPGHVQSVSRVVLIGDPAYRPFPDPMPVKPFPDVAARPHPMGEPPEQPRPQGGGLPPADAATLGEMIAALDQGINDEFVTLNRVIHAGEPAVEPLIGRLRTATGWQVPKALGAIGDRRAIDPLIDALERFPHSPFSDAAVEALELITATKAGATAKEWRAWRERTTF